MSHIASPLSFVPFPPFFPSTFTQTFAPAQTVAHLHIHTSLIASFSIGLSFAKVKKTEERFAQSFRCVSVGIQTQYHRVADRREYLYSNIGTSSLNLLVSCHNRYQGQSTTSRTIKVRGYSTIPLSIHAIGRSKQQVLLTLLQITMFHPHGKGKQKNGVRRSERVSLIIANIGTRQCLFGRRFQCNRFRHCLGALSRYRGVVVPSQEICQAGQESNSDGRNRHCLHWLGKIA